MLKEDVTILIIENKSLEKAKDIALEAWSIKARGQHIKVEFVEDTDYIYVWFVDEKDTSIRKEIEAWGEVVDERKGTDFTLEYYDVDKKILEEIDEEKLKYDNEEDVFIRIHV